MVENMMDTNGTISRIIFKSDMIPLEVLSSKLKILHENIAKTSKYINMILLFKISTITNWVMLNIISLF